jgi:nitrite reductase/ring-hydroxylating ferredoxin subunit
VRETRRALCPLAEIPDPGSRGFEIEGRFLFLVRRGNVLAGYVNSCPHTGGPLDWVEGRFLDFEQRHILCATHGAIFRIEDGHCLAGTCAGKALTKVAVVAEEGIVLLAESPAIPQ